MHSTHHAQLFFVSDSTETPFDMAALEAESEVFTFTAETFSIGEVRALIEAAYTRPFEKATRTIIVRANAIGIEAQNALLKILEEPPITTRFILVLRQGSLVLPTVLSRVQLMTVTGGVASISTGAFDAFLAASFAERMTQIATSTKNKDTDTLSALYTGLSVWLTSATSLSVNLRSQVLWCQSMLTLHGASKKMLWEEIALALPVAKQ